MSILKNCGTARLQLLITRVQLSTDAALLEYLMKSFQILRLNLSKSHISTLFLLTISDRFPKKFTFDDLMTSRINKKEKIGN